ncbi:MAG: hypothetical protein P9L93_01710 [Candidatus Gorgyraea atricola]|nr:hypothetical protein [Candidatus Gorgyraea atricola]
MKLHKSLFLAASIALFVLGGVLGIFSNNLQASPPEGEVSGGEQPASVYYDEHWKATQSYVATKNGYASFDPSSRMDTPVTGEIERTPEGPYCILQPDMVITKWKVHGHIHFE